MRNLLFKVLVGCCFTATCFCPLSAQVAKPGIGPSTLPSQQQMQELEKKKGVATQKALKAISSKLKEKLHSGGEGLIPVTGPAYTHPGLVAVGESGWEGSDNIYNISKNIGINVELVVPDENTFPVKEDAIRNRMRAVFQSAGITPDAKDALDKPPLPFLNIVIIAENINKGFAIYCSGSLFEDVDVKRAHIEKGAWQAITWDRQHLIVASTEETTYYVNKCIDDILFSFVQLYRHYQSVKPNSDR